MVLLLGLRYGSGIGSLGSVKAGQRVKHGQRPDFSSTWFGFGSAVVRFSRLQISILMCVVFCPNRLIMKKNNRNNWIRNNTNHRFMEQLVFERAPWGNACSALNLLSALPSYTACIFSCA
ncbi:hypothetical protein HanIR_Chr02g0089541 [Helianthus annuus]|nr:hypothetical protein HanIR_Chr02g0089541 [Helianthus annuus]KAJ0777988.1 hypothetical protein HanLR1_Chr02g0066751 [Helianthus annuus]